MTMAARNDHINWSETPRPTPLFPNLHEVAVRLLQSTWASRSAEIELATHEFMAPFQTHTLTAKVRDHRPGVVRSDAQHCWPHRCPWRGRVMLNTLDLDARRATLL